MFTDPASPAWLSRPLAARAFIKSISSRLLFKLQVTLLQTSTLPSTKKFKQWWPDSAAPSLFPGLHASKPDPLPRNHTMSGPSVSLVGPTLSSPNLKTGSDPLSPGKRHNPNPHPLPGSATALLDWRSSTPPSMTSSTFLRIKTPSADPDPRGRIGSWRIPSDSQTPMAVSDPRSWR